MPREGSGPRRGRRPVPGADPAAPSAEQVARLARPVQRPVHRRTTGPERPWEQTAGDDGFEHLRDASSMRRPAATCGWSSTCRAPPRTSPRVRRSRVERPGHRLDRQLPLAGRATRTSASFLPALPRAGRGDAARPGRPRCPARLAARPADHPPRHSTGSPASSGSSWTGAGRFRARRDLVAEAYDLYRLRGTRAALERLLAIYLDRRVDVVENWRLRGLGGTMLGPTATGPPPPFVAEAGCGRRAPRVVRRRRPAARGRRGDRRLGHRHGPPLHGDRARPAERRAAAVSSPRWSRRTSRRTPGARSASSATGCASDGCGSS